MKLVVGLGNPGEKYVNVRHNLGFELLEEFRKKENLADWDYQDKFKRKKLSAVIRKAKGEQP